MSFFRKLMFAVVLLSMAATGAQAAKGTDAKAEITDVMTKYEKSLNTSDTAEAMALYADDGIFMCEYFPSYIGKPAITKAYDAVFQRQKMSVKFDIQEFVQMSPEWAYVRTNSSGSVVLKSNNQTLPEGNQELFLFKKIGGQWKIWRYSFSSVNPPDQK